MSSPSAVRSGQPIHSGIGQAKAVLSRGRAKRTAGTGVKVNAIRPGPTLSEGVAGMLAGEVKQSGKPLEEVAADFVKAHRSPSIIQRAATVEEVANLCVYVASPQASATTGAALRVDGGVVDTIA
jgi:NAD(P)-dependent dehydrogenase (short-subunit alcohol dehydrogenase family)